MASLDDADIGQMSLQELKRKAREIIERPLLRGNFDDLRGQELLQGSENEATGSFTYMPRLLALELTRISEY